MIRLSSMGDILLTTPVLRALKRWNPDGEIHVVLKSNYADLLVENPNVDEIVPVDPATGFAGLVGFALKRRGNYDLVIDLHRSTRSFVIRHLLGSSRVLKYPKGVISRTIMLRTGWKAIAMREQIPERYIKALAPLGIGGDDCGIDFFIPDAVRERTLTWLKEEIPATDSPQNGRDGCPAFFTLAPGTRWAAKRWLPERFARVADRLVEDYGLAPVLIGGREERTISGSVRDQMKHPAIDLTGRLDLLETGAIIGGSRLLVCNDSGLMHMTSALSTPIVAIFGPTTRELGFFPYRARYRVIESNLSCRPCHHLGGERCPKGHHRCMTEVGVEEVVEAAAMFLEPGDTPAPQRAG